MMQMRSGVDANTGPSFPNRTRGFLFGLALGVGFVLDSHGSFALPDTNGLDNPTSVLSVRWWGFLRLGRCRV